MQSFSSWKGALPDHGRTNFAVSQKKLSLDLRETTFADGDGFRILQTIYSQTGAAILAGTPWTQYLAEEVANTNSQPAGPEV